MARDGGDSRQWTGRFGPVVRVRFQPLIALGVFRVSNQTHIHTHTRTQPQGHKGSERQYRRNITPDSSCGFCNCCSASCFKPWMLELFGKLKSRSVGRELKKQKLNVPTRSIQISLQRWKNRFILLKWFIMGIRPIRPPTLVGFNLFVGNSSDTNLLQGQGKTIESRLHLGKVI